MIKSHIAVDCEWNSWSSWSSCSKTCGAGVETRTRSKSQKELYDGICTGSAREERNCEVKSCPGK